MLASAKHLFKNRFQNGSHDWIFMHDNDPKHTSLLVRKQLADWGIIVLDWSAQFPDLYPIENLRSSVQEHHKYTLSLKSSVSQTVRVSHVKIDTHAQNDTRNPNFQSYLVSLVPINVLVWVTKHILFALKKYAAGNLAIS